MNRFAEVTGMVLVGGSLMLFVWGCGESEQTLDPVGIPHHGSSFSSTVESDGGIVEEGAVFIAFPKTKDVREIRGGWASDAVLSMLPDAAWGRLVGQGIVYVGDVELAGAIASVTGMDGADISGGLWVAVGATAGCVKCCYGCDPLPCTPCPACCYEKDKDQYPFE